MYQIEITGSQSKKNYLPELLILMFIIPMLIISCSMKPEDRAFSESFLFPEEEPHELKEIKAIFYDLCSPVETNRIFAQTDVVFDPYILNPPENHNRYSSSNKTAINLGIYGAAMSYCHLFGQTQEAINYMSAINRLAENLGIASSIVNQAGNISEVSLYPPDSLYNIATRIYLSADRELRNSDRAGTASLILAGGWIEALYIATSYLEDYGTGYKIIEEQIIAQKYSLDRLIALLSNYQDDEFTTRYMLLFRQLKILYDPVEILFERGDLVIDTINRTIESSSPEFVYPESSLRDIIKMVRLIRNDMIS